jgi:hypothetical protein
MTDEVMKRVFVEEIYPGDCTAKVLLNLVQGIIAKHGENAEVYLEDDGLAVYIYRPETDHEREVRIKNEERIKNYRYKQYLELKKEFEGPDYGGKVPIDKTA